MSFQAHLPNPTHFICLLQARSLMISFVSKNIITDLMIRRLRTNTISINVYTIYSPFHFELPDLYHPAVRCARGRCSSCAPPPPFVRTATAAIRSFRAATAVRLFRTAAAGVHSALPSTFFVPCATGPPSHRLPLPLFAVPPGRRCRRGH